MGNRVLITGSRGIAAGLTQTLAKNNYQIYLLGGEAEDSKSLANDHSQVIGYSAIDLRDEAAVEKGFNDAISKLGGLDHVVSIAGGSGRSFGDGPIESVSKSAWDQTLELNLTTAFLTAREAIKYFKNNEGGSLTLTSSVLATSPSPEYFQTAAYAVSKGAINTMVKTLSASYLQNKIRVNAVAPSLVATPMAKRAAENPAISEFTKKKQPLAPYQLPVDQVVDQTLELNLTTAFLTAREAIKYFKNNEGGSLTLTSSVLATSPSPEYFQTAAYAVSKGAINTMVKTLSASYLQNKIRVNAVAPSLVATPMAKRAAENPAISEFTKKKQPLAPYQLPVDQVVAGYLYLIENNAVTGQVLEIDGGWSTISGI